MPRTTYKLHAAPAELTHGKLSLRTFILVYSLKSSDGEDLTVWKNKHTGGYMAVAAKTAYHITPSAMHLLRAGAKLTIKELAE